MRTWTRPDEPGYNGSTQKRDESTRRGPNLRRAYEDERNMNVLVTGGAGYIGSHAVRHLRNAGARVVVVDHLELGHRDSLPDDVPLHEIDLRETESLRALMKSERIECVMHF